MATSWVKISNQALALLGKDLIVSLDEGTEAAKYCSLFYEDVRDEVLRAHAWNCAKHRAALAQSSDYVPPSGYDYAYALPVSPYCLRVLLMGEPEDKLVWKVEGRYLLTDEEEATILYIKRITDPMELDTLCVAAIAARLAADLALPLTGSRSMFDDMWNAYTAKLDEARGVNAKEGMQETLEDDDNWDTARY